MRSSHEMHGLLQNGIERMVSDVTLQEGEMCAHLGFLCSPALCFPNNYFSHACFLTVYAVYLDVKNNRFFKY